jgi:hypothetical protein
MRKQAGLVLTLLLGLAVSGCFGNDKRPPYRCLEGVSLGEMVRAAGATEYINKFGGNAEGGVEIGTMNRIFDLEQTADVGLEGLDGAMGRLCRQLRSEMSRRCDVRQFREGPGYCAAYVESPREKTTDSAGVHTHLHMLGRVNLFAVRHANKAEVILTGTEWAN